MFTENENILWEDTDPGVKRKIMAYDDKLMMVVVSFIKGSIGVLHSHPHRQASYIVSGKFEVEINGKRKNLKEGDSYFVSPGLQHGVKCLEEGKLIDVFTPVREDFLKEKK
jgi:quercetin dioxygenase-like cupin family protein